AEVEFLKDFFSSSCCFDQLASSYVWKIYSVQFAVPSELKQSVLKNSYVEDYWDNQQIRVSKHTKSQYVFQLDFNNDNFTFLGQHRTIAEASAVESPIRRETIGFPAHFFARAHNFKPPGRACQPEADSPMRT